MKNPSSRMLFSYWDALRGARAAPERGEIEPGAIRHVLADTFILEVQSDHGAFVRLAGTRLCALFGRELRGECFAALWAEAERREVRRYIEIVTGESAGLVAGLAALSEKGETTELELLLLPLRHRGKTHARMLGALSPAIVPPWIGLRSIGAVTTTSLRVIWPSLRPIAPAFAAEPATTATRGRLVVHRGGRA